MSKLSKRSDSDTKHTPAIMLSSYTHETNQTTLSESSSESDWDDNLRQGVASNNRDDFFDTYEILPVILGTGHFGCVRECKNRQTGEILAVKSIEKANVTRLDHIQREIEILDTLNHSGIMEMVDSYEDSKFVHIITKKYSGGELFDRIIKKAKSRQYFSESEALQVIKQLLEAVKYLHSNDIVHRDIKPENILLKSRKSNTLKLIDFGLARKHQVGDGKMTHRVGSPYYMSPEVLKGRYDRSCDLWSIGVIAYILLCGYPPFNGSTDYDIFQSILKGQFDFSGSVWDDISSTCKHFICCLIRRDHKKRYTAEKALQHPWIIGSKRKSKKRSITKKVLYHC